MNDSNELEDLRKQVSRIEEKVDRITELLNGTLKTNCNKMGEHIDFVERVYDNVKNPLGYICSKVGYISGSTQYSLETTRTDIDPNLMIDYDTL